MLTPPWDHETIERLNAYQQSGEFHPYTCGNDSRHRVLKATRNGWLCEDCGYRQGWVHETSVNLGEVRQAMDFVEEITTKGTSQQ